MIGAHLVAVHCWRSGREPLRATSDADVLTNPRAVSTAAADLSQALTEIGFVFEESAIGGQGFTFARRGVVIDVLAPEGLGSRARLTTIGGARTIEVPGGTQAVNRTQPMTVRSRDLEAELPVPDLLGALLLWDGIDQAVVAASVFLRLADLDARAKT